MKRIQLMLAIALLALASAASSQEADIGRFDLSPMSDAIGQTPKVNINFGPAMMAGFAETLAPGNPELGDVIRSIAGLRLMVYEDLGDVDLSAPIAEAAAELERSGWSTAIEVRDEGAQVDLFLNESSQFVEGLVLMVTETGSEAVFVNIFGDLDPVVIGKLIGSGEALKNLDLSALSEQFGSMSGDDS